ncbi:MAG: chorismate pyruvate-lyase family protein, partial [Methanomicrobiales archaeon]|nr:chorismate pyruvate-lyase family protein [Methanomicrobiales archaeon]
MGDPGLSALFEELERAVGPLSPVQRIILGTDGSVTGLLEMLTRDTVDVATLVQEVRPADSETAALLNVRPGDEVNYRVVELRNRRSGTVLLYAVSHTPLRRLEPGFRSDLMRADIPIGKILHRHRIESRREILEFSARPADGALSASLGICRGEPVLSRRYHIIHRKKPLISIQEFLPASRFAEDRRVIVEAPSRLHLSLIDMNGSLGRVDGGIGVALAEPDVLLEARWADDIVVQGGDARAQERVRKVASDLLPRLERTGALFTIHRSVPGHSGLGSGTSLSLATAAALCRLSGRTESVRTLAALSGRGGTSGIGTAAFEDGGFIIDGGHRFGEGKEKSSFLPSAASAGVLPPPVVVRHPFPEEWKILLALPNAIPGASGGEEQEIFRTACPVPREEVQEICHEVLLRMLPGLLERDLDSFGASVNRIQELGFKKVEIARQAPVVPRLIAALRDAGAACAGMSSFGPAVYAIGDTDMQTLARAAREEMKPQGGEVLVTEGRNCGARVRLEE